MMHVKSLSDTFEVRRLEPADVGLIYALCAGNELFYRYHPPFVTMESILQDMAALPPGKDKTDKFYLGFFEGETLTAIIDLILDYPDRHVAFIGFFMTDTAYQNKGVGSGIIRSLAAYLRSSGFAKIRLGVDKGNPQSFSFWKKCGFSVADEREYILMELLL